MRQTWRKFRVVMGCVIRGKLSCLVQTSTSIGPKIGAATFHAARGKACRETSRHSQALAVLIGNRGLG